MKGRKNNRLRGIERLRKTDRQKDKDRKERFSLAFFF